MAKTILGIDVGYDQLKLALVSGGEVLKTASAPMPSKLVREGRVVSAETMAELIRDAMKKNNIRCARAALALPNEAVFVRNVTVPRMTADQLMYNLPYEFRDYITDELKNYVFDYAMISTPEELAAPAPKDEDEDEVTGGMELMAVAAPVSLMEESRDWLRKAGLKLVKAAPVVSSYISLIRRLDEHKRCPEYCVLDLGYNAIRMYMFVGDRHAATRVLEMGMSGVDDVIAEAWNVDVHLAHTYLLTNYENCQQSEACRGAFNNIAVELMRALNFYRFSNPDSRLSDVFLCGGGVFIPALGAAIAENLDMTVHDADELTPAGVGLHESILMLQAIGAALE